jgi:serine/threonine protein kinase
MKWLTQYNLMRRECKQELYVSEKTGHKVILKKTEIQSGVIEVGVLQKLCGNAFPKLLDYRINGDEMHIALQFIEGNTFNRLREVEMCSFTANQLLLNALVSLDELHSSGFIHCDIKPENMIFDSQFHVYIIDFGTAQSIQYRRVRDEWRGSTFFMSPEALYTPDTVDYRSDYYSLGKCIEMSIGHELELLPYNVITCLENLGAIIPNERPSDLSEWIKTLKS